MRHVAHTAVWRLDGKEDRESCSSNLTRAGLSNPWPPSSVGALGLSYSQGGASAFARGFQSDNVCSSCNNSQLPLLPAPKHRNTDYLAVLWKPGGLEFGLRSWDDITARETRGQARGGGRGKLKLTERGCAHARGLRRELNRSTYD